MKSYQLYSALLLISILFTICRKTDAEDVDPKWKGYWTYDDGQIYFSHIYIDGEDSKFYTCEVDASGASCFGGTWSGTCYVCSSEIN